MVRIETPSLYEGVVTHIRRSPVAHRFHHRVAYWLVDYDDLPQPRHWARFCGQVRKKDHLDIRSLLAEREIQANSITMFTGSSLFGYGFDPITVYWCSSIGGDSATVVAEVRNTYGGRHAYVLERDADGGANVEKAMYVSPFNTGDGSYRIEVSDPLSTIAVSVTLDQPGQEPFVTTVLARRRPSTMAPILRSLMRRSGLRTRWLIQREGVRLWRKGMAVQPR
jgi:DUF1365 family protein